MAGRKSAGLQQVQNPFFGVSGNRRPDRSTIGRGGKVGLHPLLQIHPHQGAGGRQRATHPKLQRLQGTQLEMSLFNPYYTLIV